MPLSVKCQYTSQIGEWTSMPVTFICFGFTAAILGPFELGLVTYELPSLTE